MSRVIDITPILSESTPVYPGNPTYSLTTVRSVAEGAHSTLSEIRTGTHAGLHVDAPAHFIAGERTLEEMPLDALVGPARVVAVHGVDGQISAEEIEGLGVRSGERLLLKTTNSGLWDTEFAPDYVHLSTPAALRLAELRPACVGVDYLSVGGFKSNGTEVHEALLGAGVLVIEGLDLSEAEIGDYLLVCLPLRLARAEAAPARAVLIAD